MCHPYSYFHPLRQRKHQTQTALDVDMSWYQEEIQVQISQTTQELVSSFILAGSQRLCRSSDGFGFAARCHGVVTVSGSHE